MARTYVLDRAALARGMQNMSDKYPHHYSDFHRENDDAVTADAFLQCCLFGDIIYG